MQDGVLLRTPNAQSDNLGSGSSLVPHWLYELGKFLGSQILWPFSNIRIGRRLFGF